MILIDALAVWRVSKMLVHEEGPSQVFMKLRERTGIEHEDGIPIVVPSGNVLGCLWCTSVWVSIGMIFVPPLVRQILAVSALAIFFERKL